MSEGNKRTMMKQRIRKQCGDDNDNINNGNYIIFPLEYLPLHNKEIIKKPQRFPTTNNKETNRQYYYFYHAMMTSSSRSALFWVAITIATMNVFLLDLVPALTMSPHHGFSHYTNMAFQVPETIVFHNKDAWRKIHNYDSSSSSFHRGLVVFSTTSLLPMSRLERNRKKGPDYGSLQLRHRPRQEFESPIGIDPYDYEKAEEYREMILKTSGAMTSSGRNKTDPESDRVDLDLECRRVTWRGYNFPNCNQAHELLMERVFDIHGISQPYNVSYLNSGSYREAWRYKRNDDKDDHVVVKRLKMDAANGGIGAALNMYRIHGEAIRLERLLPSPGIVNIYGYCGSTIISEAMASDVERAIIPNGGNHLVLQTQLDALDNVYPRNNLTNSEKLQISLYMAESLAALHGFEDGSMTLGDTDIEEWLIAYDGTVKLNDLNLAKEPEWDEKAGKYCEHHSTYGKVHRSPEEYTGDSQNESVDTFAYGNMIYSMLTGLVPFYHEQAIHVPSSEIQNMIVWGRRPFVDPRYRTRSFIEGKLIEVMEKCWAQDRQRRPSIFEVVSFLREVKREAAERGELQKSNLIKIPF